MSRFARSFSSGRHHELKLAADFGMTLGGFPGDLASAIGFLGPPGLLSPGVLLGSSEGVTVPKGRF
jgi:hypothetical protein